VASQVTPLFVPDLAELQAALRLSSLDATKDVFVILTNVVREERLGFIKRLGATRVAELVAFTYDPKAAAPATTDEMLREIANLTEIAWCRMLLYQQLPILFRDSTGDAHRAFQEDALTRESNEAKRQAEIERLEEWIEEQLQILEGSQAADEESTLSASVPEAVDEQPRMEGSAYGATGRLGPYSGAS
jgi:hypothetical protein